jgi:hypothetical protein
MDRLARAAALGWGMVHRTLRKQLGVAALAAAAALSAGPPAAAQAPTPLPEQPMPMVKVIDPKDVPPLINPNNEKSVKGLSVHRRVVSKPKDGSINLDLGFNKFAVSTDNPTKGLAYNNVDELCYLSSGEAEFINDGVKVIYRPGNFMWRPARAASELVTVTKEAVEVCAFGPARADNYGHVLPREEIGRWVGDPDRKPTARILDRSQPVPVITAGGQAIGRAVITRVKDGAEKLDASYNMFKAGFATGAYSFPLERVCWLESGEVEMINNQPKAPKTIVKAGQFIYRPAGATTYISRVLADTVEICFFGPARRPDQAQEILP